MPEKLVRYERPASTQPLRYAATSLKDQEVDLPFQPC